MSNTHSQTVNITLPKPVLKQLDAMAKRDYTSRSDIIRQMILRQVRGRLPLDVDEWANQDSEKWEKVIDFREQGYPEGMPTSDLIELLEELENNDRQKQKTAS